MPERRTTLLACVLVFGLGPSAGLATDDRTILVELRRYFGIESRAERAALAERIADLPGFDRARLSAYLHDAGLYKRLEPGAQRHVSVPLGPDLRQELTLRVPAGYDPRRPWPLLYALHGMGGNGDQIVRYFEHVLGPAIEEFVVVAPTGYRISAMRSTRTAQPDHRVLLREIRRRVHIDANRQYASGYSMGGHTSWTLAATMPDEFAAIMPLAGSLTNLHSSLDEDFLGNMHNVFVAVAWGRGDNRNNRDEISKTGGIAGRNQRMRRQCEALGLAFMWHEYADRGHGGVTPPTEMLEAFLAQRRTLYPHKVRHSFRGIANARAYWLAGADWLGPAIDGAGPIALIPRAGENPDDPDDLRAMRSRAYRSRLGRIEGEIDGQTIQLNRRKVRTVICWIADGMIDWTRPITIRMGGRRAFDGVVTPDLFLCLERVRRTWDFDRLFWAGVRITSDQGVDVLTGHEDWPVLESTVEPPARSDDERLRGRSGN